MKRQQTILVAVFVVLVGLLLWQRQEQGKVRRKGTAVETVKVDPAKVTRVKIHKPDGDVEIEKSGSDWKVTKPFEYAASTEMMDQMLKSLEELKLEDVISSNPEKRATYQVDSTGTAVEVWTGSDKPALSLVVGKASADYTHTFVRRADRNEVYRAEGVLAYNFNRKPEEWKDKAILKLDEGSIKRVTLEYPKEKDKQTVMLAKVDTTTQWTVAGAGGTPEPADSLAMTRLVNNAAKLNTSTFATPEEMAGRDFTQPDFRLHVEAGGMSHTVNFVSVDENKILAKRDGSETIFSLYKSNLANLMKQPEELRKGYKPPEPAPPKPPAAAPKSKGKKTTS
jgi:hypothetical protein